MKKRVLKRSILSLVLSLSMVVSPLANAGIVAQAAEVTEVTYLDENFDSYEEQTIVSATTNTDAIENTLGSIVYRAAGANKGRSGHAKIVADSSDSTDKYLEITETRFCNSGRGITFTFSYTEEQSLPSVEELKTEGAVLELSMDVKSDYSFTLTGFGDVPVLSEESHVRAIIDAVNSKQYMIITDAEGKLVSSATADLTATGFTGADFQNYVPGGDAAKFVASIDNLKIEKKAADTNYLTVSVQDGAGEPLADVTVTIGKYELTTDASGVVKVMMPKGSYSVSAVKTGYEAEAGKDNAAEGSGTIGGADAALTMTLYAKSYTAVPETVELAGGQTYITAPAEEATATAAAYTVSVKEQLGALMEAEDYEVEWSVCPAGKDEADANVTIADGVVSVAKAWTSESDVAAYDVKASVTANGTTETGTATIYVVKSDVLTYVPKWNVPVGERHLTFNLENSVTLPVATEISMNLNWTAAPDGHSTILLNTDAGNVGGVQYTSAKELLAWTEWTGTNQWNQYSDANAFTNKGESITDVTETKVTFTINTADKTLTAVYGEETAVLPYTKDATVLKGINYGATRNCSLEITNVVVKDVTVEATGISLNTETLSLKAGQSETLVATVAPQNASDKNITWSSEDEKVATVEDGKVTAVAEGETKITASLSNGKKAECTVTVSGLNVEAESVTLNTTTATIEMGSGVTLTATISPDDTTDTTVAWSSSNERVASVTADDTVCMVKGESVGTATITVTTANGKKAECVVTVERKEADPVVTENYIIAKATGDTTEVDCSGLLSGGKVIGYQVTTAKNGEKVAQTVVESAPSLVDTKNADMLEIAPVFKYEIGVAGEKGESGYKLTGVAAGTYDITVWNAKNQRCDVYADDQMLINNFSQSGLSPDNVTVKDIVVGAEPTIATTDYANGQSANSVSLTVQIVKSPAIVDRAQKVYVLGDSLVARYYNGGNEENNNQTGWGQVLENYLTDTVDVVDLANSGITAVGLSTTAITQVTSSGCTGDLLILESGYNDKTYNTEAEMKDAVTLMVNAAKEKGMDVILVSPNASAHDYKESVAWTGYMAELSKTLEVPYIDLSKLSYSFLNKLYGSDTTVLKADYNVSDTLHSTFKGANKWASLIAGAMYEMEEESIKSLVDTDYIFTFIDSAGNIISCNAAGKVAEGYTKVTYDMNGHGAANSYLIVKAGTTLTKPNDPVASGFAFGGWYKDAGCTQEFDFTKEVTGTEVTIYAKWTENSGGIWYSQDFTDVTSDTVTSYATSTNASDKLSIDTDDALGNYLKFSFAGDTKTNSRGMYMNFTGLDVSNQEKYVVEFDAYVTSGSDQSTYLTVKGADFTYSGGNINYGAGSGYLMNMVTSKGGTTYTVNDTQTVTVPGGEWCHYKLYVDKTQALVSTTITGTTSGTIADKMIMAYDGAGNAAGLYALAGRYSAVFGFDNIVVRGVDKDTDVFGELPTEVLSGAEFSTGLETVITQTAGADATHKQIVVKANGSMGNDLTADSTIEWSVVGLENEDGYVSLTKEEGTGAGTEGEAPDGAVAYLNVRDGVSNYYGYVQAVVTYGEESFTIKTPFAVIGAGSKMDNQLAPEAGYPVNMNDYADSLVGYAGTSNGLNTKDVVLNNWSIYGSNGSRTIKLVKDDDGTKSIEFASNGGGGSTVATYQWTDQTEQYVIDFTAKFSSSMGFGVYANTPNNSDSNAEWSASYSGNALTLGTESISGISANKWYRYVVTADASVQKASITVYDSEGALVGQIEDADMANNSYTHKYFCFQGTYPMYLNSFKAYNPVLKSIVVSAEADTLKVPEAGEEAVSLDLAAALTSTDGIKMTASVDWSLEEDYAGVEIASTGAQTATLTVSEGASGTINVVATKGSVQATKEIQLTTSSNVVAFSQSVSSISIPFEGEEASVNTFTAVTRSGSGEEIDGGAITYALLAKDGVTETTVKGVTLAQDGTLTVAAGANPAVVYVKATNSEGLSNKVKVNIHGLSFAFGSGEAEEGMTQVEATLYTAKLGFGFAETSGLTVNEANVTGTADFRFKVTVPNGNYTVTVATSAESVTSEVVESLIGVSTTGISKSGTSFNVAVADGVLDLTFPAGSSVETLQITQMAAKSANEKPMIYAIGDSTTNNTASGAKSWGNVAADGGVTLPECFMGFANHGMAGRDSVNYYNEGRVEAVLLSICPGDYVTVNMGINGKTTGEGASYETMLSQYYVDAIIQRGGIPVIVTATPDGPVGDKVSANYNSATGKFTNSRGDGARNDVLRKIAAEKYLYVIELGQWGEDWMNTLTMEDVTAYNTANSTEFTTVLEMVQSWYGDHNHYKEYLGVKIAEHIFSELAEIVEAESGVVDKTALVAAIEAAEALNEAEYTKSSWSALQTALTEAKAVNADEEATALAVKTVTANLNAAKEALVKLADKTALNAAIEAAEALNKDNYTPTSWAAFETALAKAKTVADNADAAQSAVDAAKDALNEAKEALVAAADKTALNAAIEAAEALKKDDYTEESFKVLEAALAKAKTAAADADAAQEAVDAAKDALDKAVAALEEAAEIVISDLTTNHWSAAFVTDAVKKDIMSGIATNEDGSILFGLEDNLTREMLVQILYNATVTANNGVEPEVGEEIVFTDVSEGQWYTKAIIWARENGISEGYDDGTFGLGKFITRCELATMLYNYAEKFGHDTTKRAELGSFVDADKVPDWAQTTMSWAVGSEIMSGAAGGILDPTGEATRAAAATMIMQFLYPELYATE